MDLLYMDIFFWWGLAGKLVLFFWCFNWSSASKHRISWTVTPFCTFILGTVGASSAAICCQELLYHSCQFIHGEYESDHISAAWIRFLCLQLMFRGHTRTFSALVIGYFLVVDRHFLVSLHTSLWILIKEPEKILQNCLSFEWFNQKHLIPFQQ